MSLYKKGLALRLQVRTSFCVEPNSDGLYCIGVESSIATHLQWPLCEGGGCGGMVLPSKKEYMRDFMRVFIRNYLKKSLCYITRVCGLSSKKV